MRKFLLALALTTAIATPAMAGCGETITFEQMARTPTKYEGQSVKVCGRVIQVLQEGDHIAMRIDLPDYRSNAFIGPTIVIERFSVDPTEPRVLEEDVVGIKGTFTGLTSYEAIFGQTVTLPHIVADAVFIWSQTDRKWTKTQKAE